MGSEPLEVPEMVKSSVGAILSGTIDWSSESEEQEHSREIAVNKSTAGLKKCMKLV